MSGTLSLPAKEMLKIHNMDIYIQKVATPRLIFTDLFPRVQNKTLEFNSVVDTSTITKDVTDDVLAEPHMVSENSDFGDIKIGQLKTRQGSFGGHGFRVTWTDAVEERSSGIYSIYTAINRAVSRMAIFANKIVVAQAIAGAKHNFTDIPDLSDWGTDPNPGKDYDLLQYYYPYITDDLFEAGKMYMSRKAYFELNEYIRAFDPTNAKEMNKDSYRWGGLDNYNARNAFDPLSKQYQKLTRGKDINAILFADTPLIGTLEVGTSSKYSSIQSAREVDSFTASTVPMPMINAVPTPNLGEMEQGISMWFNIGLNIQEPDAIMIGNIGEKTDPLPPLTP